MTAPRLLPRTIAFAMAVGCCSCDARYRGDGELKDLGVAAAHHRYELVLGSLDVRREGAATYHLVGLPHEEFTAGIEGIDACLVDPGASP
ncbi:MAG TPA: hypothetical protein VFL14_09330, partial [Xanthomonadales bacterium]|nr:hypothetical protein [Xanthomonadales bacterium]